MSREETGRDDTAFPMEVREWSDGEEEYVFSHVTPGMTKREYFAAHAPVDRTAGGFIECRAADAVAYADALIAELNK